MTFAVISLAFDSLLVGLLAVMIYYAVKLNQRIVMLREREGELQSMMGQFTDASLLAEEGASRLRAAGMEAEVGVRGVVAKAAAMRNDLELMIDQALALVDKIETETERQEQIRRAGERAASEPDRGLAGRRPQPFEPAQAGGGASAGAKAFPPAAPARNRPMPDRQPDRQPDRRPVRHPVEPRTEAERHLLEAIRAAKEGVV